MKTSKSASNCSEEVTIKNLRRPRLGTPSKEVVYIKLYESQYPVMLRPERKKKLLKQVAWSIVRMKRAKPMPPESFSFSYEYPTAAANVKVTVPVITGGPWRFDAVPGLDIQEVTQLTPYHTTPLHAMPCTVPQALVPGYRCQISPTFPACQCQCQCKFPSDA